MNVYDHQASKSKLSKSKKLSKSTENASKLVEKEQAREQKSKAEVKKDQIEMPMKITPLNVSIKKDKPVESDDPQKIRANIDYAQTDENETLQDISTSFSEDKFDSLPEQMNSEAIKRQFHEAFKSMSVVNEEMSDQDSSLNEDKKTEIEKEKPITFQQVNQINQVVNAFKTEKINIDDHSKEMASLKNEKFKKEDKIEVETEIIKEEIIEKDQTKNNVNANLNIQNDQNDKKIENVDVDVKEVKEEINVDENNNQMFKDFGEIIITNIHTLSAFNVSKKQEQSEMIDKGWVIVDSIKEIEEKTLEKEESTISESLKKDDKDGKDKSNNNVRKQSKESLKKQESEECLVKPVFKEATLIKQESKEIKKENSKESFAKQQSSKETISSKQSSKDEKSRKSSIKDESIKQEQQDIKIKKQDSKISLSSIKKENSLEKDKEKVKVEEKIIKVNQTEDQIGTKNNTIVDRVEDNLLEKSKNEKIKSLDQKTKAKSQDSPDKLKSIKKSTSTSSSNTSLEKESKIPKLSKQSKLIKSSSTSSTPSKKSTCSTKSSKSTSSKKSSPIKKAKTLTLQTTLEEASKERNDKESVKIEEKKLDKIIIFDEDKINIVREPSIDEPSVFSEFRTDDLNDQMESLTKSENNQTTNKSDKRRLSIVSFPTLPDLNNLNAEIDNSANRKKYAKTPIKQLSIEEKENLVSKLNEEDREEISVHNDDDDSSPQSLNDEINKEQIRKEKNELIESMDKQVREESIKKIEENIVRKLIDEEQKIISGNDEMIKKDKIEFIKQEIIKKEDNKSKTEIKLKEKTEEKEAKSLSTAVDEENKKDEADAKVQEQKTEIIYKKTSVEKDQDISERTAYIENMLRTSGYTDKIIEKANEFISNKNSQNNDDGVVEEVRLKLVKRNSKDYYNGFKDQPKQQVEQQQAHGDGDEKTAAKSNSKSTISEKKEANDEVAKDTKVSKEQTTTSAQSSSKSKETSANQLKKSTSMSKIPTLQASKMKKIKEETDPNKMEDQSFKRNCLKPLQTKSEPIEQAINRPVFKRKKSDLPPKHSIHLNSQEIKRKWNDIKTNQKDKMYHQQQFYSSSHLRRATSNPVISNSFDLIYEVNKMPQWARNSQTNKKSQSDKSKNQQQRSNTTSIITQTKRVLEKIEKKEIEEVTTRTIINDEEKFTRTNREESRTHFSETEETSQSIRGKECSICKKLIIPITEEMKFCKKNLRKMLSDSELEVKTCRC